MTEIISYNAESNRIYIKCGECQSELKIEYSPLGGELSCPYCFAVNEIPNQHKLSDYLSSHNQPLSSQAQETKDSCDHQISNEPRLEDLLAKQEWASNEELVQVKKPRTKKKTRLKSKGQNQRSETRLRKAQKKSSKPMVVMILSLLIFVGVGFFIWKNQDLNLEVTQVDEGNVNEQDAPVATSSGGNRESISSNSTFDSSNNSEPLVPKLNKQAYVPKVPQPNIVFVCAEGISLDWLSNYGGKERTPNIERMADNGLLFKTAWMQPSSISSHASILSGQYPFRHGVYDEKSDKILLNPQNSWLGLLSKRKYQTAFFGKWPFTKFQANDFGFKLYEADKGKAYNFIREQRSKSFVLYVNYDVSKQGDFSRSVTGLDKFIGNIQLTLMKEKLNNKTIFIFTSDGASKQLGEYKLNVAKRPSGVKPPAKVQNNRQQLNDLGVAVPLIVSAPFLIPRNGFYTCDLVDSSDFFPTIQELCGLRTSNYKIDGRSFVKTLRGDLNPLVKRSWIYSESKDERMVRDWNYLYYNDKKFYGLKYDPLQSYNLHKIRHNDKVAPGARDRLKMIMKRVGS